MFQQLSFLSMAFGVAFVHSCTEILTVTDMDFRQSVDCDYFGFPCDTLEGDYYFSGLDSSGNPTYTQPSTGAYFSVYVEPFNSALASLAFTYPSLSAYFAPTWDHFADVTFKSGCNSLDIFEVESGALEGATNILYFPVAGTNTNYPPLYITATLDDCQYIGFDNAPPPTPSPTPNPVTATTCPNYDDTIYGDCNSDIYCINCQPWGCAQCLGGYYKMGNEKRCQSCTQNYPNCESCSDWNGCVACNAGFNLDYEASCNDEICK